MKPGDKVKVVENVSGDFVGDTGVVTCVDRTNLFGRQIIDVRLDNHHNHHTTSCFYPKELEIVTTALK